MMEDQAGCIVIAILKKHITVIVDNVDDVDFEFDDVDFEFDDVDFEFDVVDVG